MLFTQPIIEKCDKPDAQAAPDSSKKEIQQLK